VSKIHINKVGWNSPETYDSISFGEKIFVEEMPRQNIPADYKRIENPEENKNSIPKSYSQKSVMFDNLLKTITKTVAIAAIGFIAYSLFGGILDSSEFVMKPLGREVGIAFGMFVTVSIITLLVLSSKTKIKLFVEDGMLNIKCYKGLNHRIPIENIADCKINIFSNSDSISSLTNLKQYNVDLDSGLLVILKNGQNLLIASSNSYQTNKNLVFN